MEDTTNPIQRRVMDAAGAVLVLAMFSIVALTMASMWGISKSRERAACYRTAERVTDCPQPGAFESFIRWVNTTDTTNTEDAP